MGGCCTKRNQALLPTGPRPAEEDGKETVPPDGNTGEEGDGRELEAADAAERGKGAGGGGETAGDAGSGGGDDAGQGDAAGAAVDPQVAGSPAVAETSTSEVVPGGAAGDDKGAVAEADASAAAGVEAKQEVGGGAQDEAPSPDKEKAAAEAAAVEAAATASPAPAPTPAKPVRVPPQLEMVAGAFSAQGFKAGMPGWPNQDTHLVCWPCQDLMLAAVFDGHGREGHRISSRVRGIFQSNGATLASQLENGLQEAFEPFFRFIQGTLLQEGLSKFSGTTATVAFIDGARAEAIVAHVGDSTMIVSDGASVVFHTEDHKIDEEVEKRVIAHGGEIRSATISSVTTRRVYLPGAEFPGLAMARAFGDICAHTLGVTCIPQVVRIPVSAGHLLVLASDGVWDTVPPDEAVKYLAERQAPKPDGSVAGVAELAQALVTEAHARYPPEAVNKDDATAVVVRLRPYKSTTAKAAEAAAAAIANSAAPVPTAGSAGIVATAGNGASVAKVAPAAANSVLPPVASSNGAPSTSGSARRSPAESPPSGGLDPLSVV